MKLHRRQFMQFGVSAVATSIVRQAHAQATYPTRPGRIIAATSPGSAPDIIARMAGQMLSERLGQPLVIENRAGGGGNIGTEAAIRSAPDGYTLLLVSIAHATNATLYDKLNFNFLRDIAPVAGIVRIPNLLVVHPSLPVSSVPELLAYAKANAGKINVASAGMGSAPHLAYELLKSTTRLDLVHVPYRGATPALTDLLAGQVQMMFPTIASSLEHVRAGKLRALAVTSPSRWEGLPEIPTVSDFLPGFETTLWAGLGVPRDTPTQVITILGNAISSGLTDQKVKARLIQMGGVPMPMTQFEFSKFVTDETEKWAKIIQLANIKAE